MSVKYDNESLYEGLVKHGLIVPTNVQGAFGRGAVFEDVLERFNGLVTKISKDDQAEVFTFPPIIERRILEKVHYLDNFPHLCGAVYSFFGKELAARQLAEDVNAGKPWGDKLGMTDVVLNPAACYPVYPSFTGTLKKGGRLVTMLNWVYRHEPSPEPTRMQSFRVREFVRVGTPDEVVEWRDMWLQRGLKLLTDLGLPATPDVAADPFFGRGGKVQKALQREQALKFEFTIPICSTEKPTAIGSCNYHVDHFGETFGIRTSEGEVAHSACVGFGLERVALALFKTHGLELDAWPREVRDVLAFA